VVELRSNLPVGTSRWATRRAQWLSLGISDEDMTKPKIAIVNSSSDLASCFAHLDGIVGPLKQAIREAGGLAFEVRTAAPSITDYPILLRGSKEPIAELPPSVLYARACQQKWLDACRLATKQP